MLTLTSPVFEAGQPIPTQYTGDGEDVSPPLEWEGVPDGTMEFALLCEDPDAPRKEPWVHWVLYGVPKERRGLPEANSGGGFEGKNSWERPGYGGPQPPAGHGAHHYHFKLFALDDAVSLPLGATKQDLLAAIEGHVLDRAELVGTYEREGT